MEPDGTEEVNNDIESDVKAEVEQPEPFEPIEPTPDFANQYDEEQSRRQAARDDSAAQRAALQENPGVGQGEDSKPDERVPSTGEAADGEDDEQARRRAAREDSDQQRETHAEQSNVDGAHNTYEQPEADDSATAGTPEGE